jgi:hypothetical protein
MRNTLYSLEIFSFNVFVIIKDPKFVLLLH